MREGEGNRAPGCRAIHLPRQLPDFGRLRTIIGSSEISQVAKVMHDTV